MNSINKIKIKIWKLEQAAGDRSLEFPTGGTSAENFVILGVRRLFRGEGWWGMLNICALSAEKTDV